MKNRFLTLLTLASSVGIFFQSCASFGKRNKSLIDLSEPDSISFIGNNNFVLYKNSEATDTVCFESGMDLLVEPRARRKDNGTIYYMDSDFHTLSGLSKYRGYILLNGKKVKANSDIVNWKGWRRDYHLPYGHSSHYSNFK